MTPAAVARRKWEAPQDQELLEHTDRLLALHVARESARRRFEAAKANLSELCDQRAELEDRLLAGERKASGELVGLTAELSICPRLVADAAALLAAATIA